MRRVVRDPGLPLTRTDVGDDRTDVVFRHRYLRRHRSEVPVVLTHAHLGCTVKRLVRVVIRGIDRIQERWALGCSPEIESMAGSAGAFEQETTFSDQIGF